MSTGAPSRTSVGGTGSARLHRSPVPSSHVSSAISTQQQQLSPHLNNANASPAGPFDFNESFLTVSRPSLPRQGGGKQRHLSTRARALARASIAGATTPANNVFAVQIDGDDGGIEVRAVQSSLLQAVCLRANYKSKDRGQYEVGLSGGADPSAPPPRTLHLEDGIFSFLDQRTVAVSWEDYYDDVTALLDSVNDPSCQRACRRRLHVLEQKYNLYELCNGDAEKGADRYRRGAGLFSDACCVDNNIVLAHATSSPQLIDFMMDKIEKHSEDVVAITRDREGAGETPETLGRVCTLLDLADPQSLTPEGLGLQPLSEKPIVFYDPLDPRANPGGANSVELLRLFLTPHTLNQGAYLAECVVGSTLDANDARVRCPQATEMILDVSGVLPDEWEGLAAWVRQHHLLNYRTNRFQIRITRPVKRRRGAGNGAAENSMMGATGAASGLVGGEGVLDDSENLLNAHLSSRFSPSVTPLVFDSHQQHLDSLFLPLFHATLAPEDPKNADLAALLEQVGSIDLVLDSAAGGERSSQRRRRRPADVPWSEPVDDLYFSYYVWANLCSLNAFRRRRGMNTFQLRGAAGRLAGSSSPKLGLVIAFLLCDHVLDGLALMDAPVLQYLYALHRIGVSVSPTASSSLGATTYTKHPLRSYLRSGLRVSLGTSSPLLFHVSSQPLVEEYNTARRLFKLGGADLCELALNSVTMSSFDASTLATWIGEPFAAELEKLQHSTVMLPMERHATLTAAASSNGSASPDMGKRPSNTTPTPTAAGARLPESVGELIAYFVNNDVLSEAWRQNAVELTAVPTSRLEFRWETWAAELDVLISAADAAESSAAGGGAGKTSLPTTSAVAVAEGEPQQQQQQQSEGALVEKGKQAPSKRPSVSIRHGTVDEVPSSSLAQLLQHGGVRPRAPYVVTDPALDFPRVALTGPYDRDTQFATAAQAIARALVLRHEYMQQLKRPDDCGGEVRSLFALIQNPLYQTEEAFKTRGSKKEKSSSGPDGYVFDEDEWMYKTVEGVVVPHEVHQIPRLPQDMYHFDDFKHHVEELRALMENPLIRSFATSRLRMLERRFSLHVAVNHSREAGTTTAKASQNRDFYQSTKVDNTVRMECGMTSRQLLDFILSKAHNNGDDIVSHQRGKEPQTLRQLLHELDISVESLTVDDLNVQGDTASGSQASTLYKPDGRDELLTLVLKTDNRMNGRYFAELTKHVFENMKRDRYTFSENRLSIYGQSPEEWSLLSSWFDTHGMSSSHNQWVIQLPRIYGYLRKHGRVQNFAEYLENIFKPLWSISLHPSKDPRLFHCVNHITGFDCVEDEHRTDIPLHTITQPPHEWTSEEDPPYNYYLYHLWANVSSLNEFRRRRRFSTFTLRPSCGESGSLDHLIGGFLLSNSISYGVQLVESDVLQYLYYLAQIGVTMCPLSNNGKVLSYLAHPFPKFFRRGLKVSLGTDCPLLFHHTQEPLIEEYSIASKIWKLSPNDMCEIARNSVLLSGFSPVFKQERLGELYFLSSSRSNDASRTHVSDIRVAYRFEAVHGELGFLEYISGHSFPKPVLTLNDEAALEQEYTQRLCQLREQPLQGVLIDANPDNTDIDALQRTRTHMQKQLEELQFTLSGLQKQNKQLTEKLADEREREQQVSVMRRHQVASRANDELQGYERLLLQQHMAGMTSEEQKTFRDRLEREEPGVLLAEVNASARFPLRGGMPTTTTTTMPQSQDDGAALDVAEESGNRAWQLQDSPGDWGLAMDDFYMQGQRGGGGGESGAAATHPNNAVQPLAGSAEDGSGLIVTSRSGPLRPLASTATGTVTLNRGALLGLSETMWAKGTEEGPVEVGRARAEDAVGNADAVKGKHSDGAASQRTRRGQEGGAGLPPVRAGRISSASFSVPSTGRLGKGDDGVTRTMPPRY